MRGGAGSCCLGRECPGSIGWCCWCVGIPGDVVGFAALDRRTAILRYSQTGMSASLLRRWLFDRRTAILRYSQTRMSASLLRHWLFGPADGYPTLFADKNVCVPVAPLALGPADGYPTLFADRNVCVPVAPLALDRRTAILRYSQTGMSASLCAVGSLDRRDGHPALFGDQLAEGYFVYLAVGEEGRESWMVKRLGTLKLARCSLQWARVPSRLPAGQA